MGAFRQKAPARPDSVRQRLHVTAAWSRHAMAAPAARHHVTIDAWAGLAGRRPQLRKQSQAGRGIISIGRPRRRSIDRSTAERGEKLPSRHGIIERASDRSGDTSGPGGAALFIIRCPASGWPRRPVASRERGNM
ncbi:hypothetical protein SEVIR_1G326050v4 [Setaria viridis]